MKSEKPHYMKRFAKWPLADRYEVEEAIKEALAESEAKFQECDLRRIHLQQLSDEQEAKIKELQDFIDRLNKENLRISLASLDEPLRPEWHRAIEKVLKAIDSRRTA